MANNAFDDCEKVEKALWFCDFFMFKRDWVHLQQLKEMQSSRYEEGVPFVNKMYTKVLPFLCKKLYKRVMGWTSGRSFPVWYFFLTTPELPSPPPGLPLYPGLESSSSVAESRPRR